MRQATGTYSLLQPWYPLETGTFGLSNPCARHLVTGRRHLYAGRVCMAAFVGWLVAVSGVHFPGLCSFSEGVSFEDLSKLAPLEQWSALPALGKQQIIMAIGIIEHQSEWKIKPHYMKGGTPGSLKGLKSFWDPAGLTSKMSAEKLERQRLCELKNGRLAMLGITSVLIANTVPGAIPLPITFPDSAAFVLPF